MLGLPAKLLHKSFLFGWDSQEACTGRPFPSLFFKSFAGWKLCQGVKEGKGEQTSILVVLVSIQAKLEVTSR